MVNKRHAAKPVELFLNLYFKRAKLFLTQINGAEARFQAGVGGPHKAPLWVKDTIGYALGIKDGSIVDITPPRAVQLAEAKIAEEKAKVKAAEPAPEEDEEEDKIALPAAVAGFVSGQPQHRVKASAGKAK